MQHTGFTLIELLVVVMIISVLTAVAMPQYRKSLDRAKAAEAAQLLPAIFEARERWMIEHGCRWTDDGYTCADDSKMTFGKLDIEAKCTITTDLNTLSNNKLTTPYWEYYLHLGKPSTSWQPCVGAKPRWGGTRYDDVVVYYRGDHLSCQDGDAGDLCDILNVGEFAMGCQ